MRLIVSLSFFLYLLTSLCVCFSLSVHPSLFLFHFSPLPHIQFLSISHIFPFIFLCLYEFFLSLFFSLSSFVCLLNYFFFYLSLSRLLSYLLSFFLSFFLFHLTLSVALYFKFSLSLSLSHSECVTLYSSFSFFYQSSLCLSLKRLKHKILRQPEWQSMMLYLPKIQ